MSRRFDSGSFLGEQDIPGLLSVLKSSPANCVSDEEWDESEVWSACDSLLPGLGSVILGGVGWVWRGLGLLLLRRCRLARRGLLVSRSVSDGGAQVTLSRVDLSKRFECRALLRSGRPGDADNDSPLAIQPGRNKWKDEPNCDLHFLLAFLALDLGDFLRGTVESVSC